MPTAEKLKLTKKEKSDAQGYITSNNCEVKKPESKSNKIIKPL